MRKETSPDVLSGAEKGNLLGWRKRVRAIGLWGVAVSRVPIRRGICGRGCPAQPIDVMSLPDGCVERDSSAGLRSRLRDRSFAV
jgi:hypothetical protein